jgi:hypothetical protein
MSLYAAKREASRLKLADLKALDEYVHHLLVDLEMESHQAARKSKREVVAVKTVGHKTYQRELVRCGKEHCKCAGGELHGPYWYAYWKEGGRTRSKYIGKELKE